MVSINDSGHLRCYLLLLLLLMMLSSGDLSPINDNNNQHQAASVTNTIVHQSTSPTLSSLTINTPQALSTNMQWIKTLKNVTENGGRTVLLECQVRSAYPVSFNWYRYNNPLDKRRFMTDESAQQSSIQLRKLKESEAGFYTCQASNGFQTLRTTGFVRVKNSADSNDMELNNIYNDDPLPSLEFQPEIITNNEPTVVVVKLKCEIYSGDLCRPIIGSRLISMSNQNQNDIERNLLDGFKLFTQHPMLTNECRRLILPMICLFTFPICDSDRMNTRPICRRSCHYFQNQACSMLFASQLTSYSDIPNMPTCDSLPPASDDSSCIHFEQADSSRQNVSSPANIRPIAQRPSTTDTLGTILISVIVPVAIVSLFMILFCWCCHRRNNESRLSSCSSTSTPIQKSSHLVRTTTSSPFRSTMSTDSKHLHLHPIPLASSSSSGNSNFAHTHLRQTLLRPEHTRPTIVSTTIAGGGLSEIPFANIRFLQELGEGDYGRIYKGEIIGGLDGTNSLPSKCLIKTLQTDCATQQIREEYFREIEIFRHIRHTNISCLLGVCVQPQDALSLMLYERLNEGDLHEYLLQRSTTTAMTLHQQRDLSDFLYISIQIVSGMIYLAEKNFVHNDLSAKNILISEHMDIKISNIARCRAKYDMDYYKIANRALPVRWMAIESLLSGIYSEMSDVWAFGVLLWEMFSYGAQPYTGRTNPEVIEMIRDRQLLICPINCPKRIYTLMCSCWEELSEQRPTFTELMLRLRQWEEKSATLSSTTSSSLVDVPPGIDHQIQQTKYRTFISPPPPPPPPLPSFVRNDVLSASARTVPLVDRDSIRFEV